ncbi:hypothetical protein P43SY_006205 [Pythium insidiosum]|uniref:PIPK domain-containing protein n=1 Tax=Pythium insidiosum TaxID=114742 RepID=A0AAD5MA58_PYTIN|nr:hypothetical protein P43SY_006205 [Pythium insidiosum]
MLRTSHHELSVTTGSATTAREIYLQTGALISLASGAAIVLSYLLRRRWRRHPNALLFWKTVIDMVYAVRFLYGWDQLVSATGCRALAALTIFSMTSSECWFLSMSLDLYRCTTNPFTNVQLNLQWYHAFSWGLGSLFAGALWFSGVQLYSDADPHCYITEHDTALMLLYYLVVVLSVLVALGFSVLENQSYPHGGMQQALQAKKDVIRSARIFTLAYIVYQIVLITLWIADLATQQAHSWRHAPIRDLSSLLQTSKGLIDLVIWISMNGVPFLAASSSRHDQDSDRDSDIDVDLQPQLNVALRKEVLHFTTRGVVAASANTHRVLDSRRVVRLRLHELGMAVRFDDYHPRVFRDIRRGFGIDEAQYRASFLATCHERIEAGGGSSGAFMFYTADYMFLVKTITPQERAVLLRMLPAYIQHMRTNPSSHLSRFYGCHSIEMYGQVFSFIVMGNVIGRVSMHQFYDIKGSWIDRNAKPIPLGKTVICTYCSHAFQNGSNETCEYSIHGTHLPHIVLLDNDFHRKLRVAPETALAIVEQLERDTAFLRTQGVMDYSLLLSIHSTKFVVDQSSVDVDHLAVAQTQRRVNFAVCHRASEDRAITASSSSLDGGDHAPHHRVSRVNVEILDGLDFVSSDDDAEDEDDGIDDDAIIGHTPTGLPACSTPSRTKARHFRYSVVRDTYEDESAATAETPLLSRTPTVSHSRYDGQGSTQAAAAAAAAALTSATTAWIGVRTPEKPGYQATAVVGPDYYTIGIVDMLQTWTWQKRLERLWKVYVLQHDPNGISAAPPSLYAERFQRKMRAIMMVPPTASVSLGEE